MGGKKKGKVDREELLFFVEEESDSVALGENLRAELFAEDPNAVFFQILLKRKFLHRAERERNLEIADSDQGWEGFDDEIGSGQCAHAAGSMRKRAQFLVDRNFQRILPISPSGSLPINSTEMSSLGL